MVQPWESNQLDMLGGSPPGVTYLWINEGQYPSEFTSVELGMKTSIRATTSSDLSARQGEQKGRMN